MRNRPHARQILPAFPLLKTAVPAALIALMALAGYHAAAAAVPSRAVALKRDGVITYVPHMTARERAPFSILIAHDSAVVERIRTLVPGGKLALVVSVHQRAAGAPFDFSRLIFAQNGRVWSAAPNNADNLIIPLEIPSGRAGAQVSGTVYQAVMLLPAPFSMQSPLSVRYAE